MNNIDIITTYLDEIIPNPICELKYNKDYELLIAVMLSAQTTDKRVNQVTEILFDKYKSTNELKNANIEDIKNIIRSIGTFNKKSKNVIEIARIIDEEYNSIMPKDRRKLEKMPGVGRKTINVVLSELYNEPYLAVDTHVSRVSKRLKLASKKDNVLEIEKKLTKKFKNKDLARIHKQLVLFGRYYCKSKNPICESCKLNKICNKK